MGIKSRKEISLVNNGNNNKNSFPPPAKYPQVATAELFFSTKRRLVLRRLDGWCMNLIRKWKRNNKRKAAAQATSTHDGNKASRGLKLLNNLNNWRINWKRKTLVGVFLFYLFCCFTLWPRSTTSSSSEASEQKSSLSPPLELRLDVLLTFLLYNWLANAFDPAAIPLLPGLCDTKWNI